MVLGAAALAYVLLGQQPGGILQAADKKPAAHSSAKPEAGGALQHMELQAQFAGPLKDTVVQRWRDTDTGAICYIYLPVIVQHSPQMPNGLVQYGANGIGSISCLPPR